MIRVYTVRASFDVLLEGEPNELIAELHLALREVVGRRAGALLDSASVVLELEHRPRDAR